MPYLIFNSFEEATARSVKAGKDIGLPFYGGYDTPTRYMWSRRSEHGDNPRGALSISDPQDLLTPTETSALVNELPADWNHPPNPFEQ